LAQESDVSKPSVYAVCEQIDFVKVFCSISIGPKPHDSGNGGALLSDETSKLAPSFSAYHDLSAKN